MEPQYAIGRVDGVIGGFVTTDKHLFDRKTLLSILNTLDDDMKEHKDHDVSYIFHSKGEHGVADPLNKFGTAGWKCHDCNRRVK